MQFAALGSITLPAVTFGISYCWKIYYYLLRWTVATKYPTCSAADETRGKEVI